MKLHLSVLGALLLLAVHGAGEVLRAAQPRSMRGGRIGDQAEPALALDQEENVPLDKLEEVVIAKLKSGESRTTLEMKTFVRMISKMISRIKPKILSGHKKAEATLKSLRKAFSRCRGTKNSQLSVVKQLQKSVTGKRKLHGTCRKRERRAWIGNTACVKLMETKEQLVESNCKTEAMLRKNPHSEAKKCHTTNVPEPYDQWIERNMRWFQEKDKVYSTAKKKCDDAVNTRRTEKVKCDKQAKQYKLKRRSCDLKQDMFEGSMCSLAKKILAACEGYDTCYKSASDSLDKQGKSIKKDEKGRKVEWRALMRINCLLGVFDSDGGDDAAIINKCKAQTHPTDQLSLKYPTAPGKGKCVNMPDVPCGTSFMKTEYGRMPKGTKPKQCNQCVLEMNGFGSEPLVWLTAENWEPATGRWRNRGSAGTLQNVVARGTASLMLTGGHGARGRILAVWGGTSTVLNFGNIVPQQYTMCSLTRYIGKHRRRILNGAGVNWLHGHWHGKAGVAYFHGWKTQHKRSAWRSNKQWTAMCSKNSGAPPSNVLVNGVPVGKTAGGAAPTSLWINGGVHGRETSEFAIAELMIWDGPLTDFHMSKAMAHLMQRLNNRKMSKGEEKKLINMVKNANMVAKRGR